MLPSEEEMEVDDCCTKCNNGFYKIWNFLAMIFWGGFFAAFFMLRWDQVKAQQCPMPWDWFMMIDSLFQVLYYLTSAIVECGCTNDEGDVTKSGQFIHIVRMCCCLPVSFCWWLAGGAFLGFNFECLMFEADPPKKFDFFWTACGYMAIRMFQNYVTWLILCLQCCALDTFRKQIVSVETGKLSEDKQAVAANVSVQHWAIIVGVKTISTDALVGYGGAEDFRRRKRDLEEGYKVYSYEKRGKRNYTVTHVKTKAEKEEEKAAERMKHHKEVFPFMRMTNVVRQKDVTLENPFGHMAAGCTDLAAANKAALVVEQAARAVAKRSGAHNVGVAARRER